MVRCYVLTLPLLFLIPHHPFTPLPTKPLIPGTALQSSLTSPIPFLLTLLISSLALPLSPSTSNPCYALGPIPPTVSLSSALIILMETPQSLGSWLALIKPMFTPWSTLPSATNMFALLTTLMVVTNKLSSYLLNLISSSP